MKKHVSMATLLLAILASAGASSADATQRHDAWITMKTKLALLTSPDVAGLRINVDTVDSRVTLHGNVESKAQDNKATEVARGIEGVVGVRNLLQVVPDSRRKVVTRADEQVKQDVKQALAAAPVLADSSIRVESVNKGVVLLDGTATSVTDSVRSIEIANNVAGVARVETKVQTPNALVDDEIWQTRQPTEVAGSWQAIDAWVTTKVKLRLLANESTPATEINVDTDDGVVTLFGVVPTERSKKIAGDEAALVEDVKSVVNVLQVVPEAKQDAVEAKDEVILTRVETALSESPDLQGSDIKVEVKNGVVRLTGTIVRRSDRLDAVMAARRIVGVRAVREELTLEVPQPTGG